MIQSRTRQKPSKLLLDRRLAHQRCPCRLLLSPLLAFPARRSHQFRQSACQMTSLLLLSPLAQRSPHPAIWPFTSSTVASAIQDDAWQWLTSEDIFSTALAQWSITCPGSLATCASCALPISGRIVTASGSGSSSPLLKARFHPECFNCYHCSTALECVAFYPEPEDKRLKRLESEGLLDNDEGNELRFYCHLDFHEFFSPRCRSCKTPIEGEVIVAAGAEWHVGHFFCSECGDPFDAGTPFVEKDKYAYCVGCHTRRTSARCKACRKQILDETTIQALGGQWHLDCFRCHECAGDFGEDGRFFIREVTMERTEKEKRRGVGPKTEETAVCEACEGRRLKA